MLAIISLCLFTYISAFFSLLLKGIAQQALEHNYKLVLFQTDYKEERELEALQMLKQKQIDSLIICSRASDWSIIEDYLPFGSIVLCEDVQERQVSSTFVNQYKIFYSALEYLYKKGHQRIGYCIGRKSGTNSQYRGFAYQDFHMQYKLSYQPDYIIDKCIYFEDGEKAIKQLKKMEIPPTALLVTSDQVAAGIVVSCQKHGISIPNQLSIIGFDNEPIAKMMNITTIQIPLLEMGRNLFLQAVQDDLSNKELSSRLIERETV